MRRHIHPVKATLLAIACCVPLTALAQDPPAEAPPAAPKVDLSQAQLQLLRDFERFEKSLYDVAEFSRRTDPEQSELLYRARSQSQEQRILDDMRLLADALKPQTGGKLVIGDSPEKQDEVIARLQTLLKVLQSADERDRLQREIDRVQDLLKGTNALIGKQRDVRSDTGRGGDLRELTEREKKLLEEAGKLADKIDRQDAERRGDAPESKPSDRKQPDDGKPGDEKPADGQPMEPMPGSENKPGSESKPGEQEGQSAKPAEGSPMTKPAEGSPMKGSDQKPEKEGEKDPSKPGEKSPDGKQPMPPEDMPPMDGAAPKPGESQEGSPMQGQKGRPPEQPPQQGQSQKGQPKPGQPPQELGQPSQQGQQQPPQEGGEQPQQEGKTPGREELEEARDQMQRALEELDKQNREGSTEAQQQALAQLEKVKARLEEILRQLREEENELLLASLESRFQKLRKAQMLVNAETVRLDKSAGADQSRHLDRAVALGRDEREIVVDAEKALALLKEEGSSVAFPEAIEQMRDNMLTVADRLNRGDTAGTTQVLEELIVETLDEMILAMQQEMEKKKDKDKQQQQQQQQQQGDEQNALINELAELKMIRSLQNQINRLTRQIGRELEGEQAQDPDLLKMTEDLSRRQKRLQDATYDLATGKNK